MLREFRYLHKDCSGKACAHRILPYEAPCSMCINETSYQKVSADLTVRVQELVAMDAVSDYGLYVWPSAKLLADFVWRQQTWFRGKVVVEIEVTKAVVTIMAKELIVKMIVR